MKVRKVLWKYKPNKDGTCLIRIYVYHNKKKKYFSTGIAVFPKHWNEKTRLVKRSHPFAAQYNAIVNSKKHELEAHFLEGGTMEDFDVGDGSFMDYLHHFIGNNDLRPGTIKVYRGAFTRLKQYLDYYHLNDISFQDIDLEFYKKYIAFLKDQGYCGDIGAGNHIKVMKKLLRKAQNEGLHRNEAYKDAEFKVLKSKGSNKIYLNEEEIAQLEELDLSTQKPMERERDRFLLSYYFLLRFSDVTRIRRNMIFTRKDKQYLSIRHLKTSIDVILPVGSKAALLLEKYDYDLSFSSNQQANRRLKTICALAGINQLVSEGSRSGPKSQLVGTHTARRSAATNLCLQGISLKIIADLGGWKETRTLRLYLRQSGIDTAIVASEIDFFK